MSQRTNPALAELLVPAAVACDLKASDKDGVLAELCGLAAFAGLVKESGAPLQAVRQREAQGSTGCGSGVAVPHARLAGLDRTAVAVGLSRAGVEFGSVDREPVHIFFLLLGPAGSPEAYLKALSQVARLVKETDFRKALRACASPAEVVALIRSHAV
ncbi:MAG: PTS sugar transporter subunit IIA [Elusimicrobia bacterium]|nr:PTS sugar transporter subunit IIA [Elusimicrobiota bacterium]